MSFFPNSAYQLGRFSASAHAVPLHCQGPSRALLPHEISSGTLLPQDPCPLHSVLSDTESPQIILSLPPKRIPVKSLPSLSLSLLEFPSLVPQSWVKPTGLKARKLLPSVWPQFSRDSKKPSHALPHNSALLLCRRVRTHRVHTGSLLFPRPQSDPAWGLGSYK